MPKQKPLERNLQATILRKFTALRAQDDRLVFRKRHGTSLGLAGDPDVYGLWAGLHFELELKAPGKAPSQLQSHRLAEWHGAGARTVVIDNIQAFDNFIAQLRGLVPKL